MLHSSPYKPDSYNNCWSELLIIKWIVLVLNAVWSIWLWSNTQLCSKLGKQYGTQGHSVFWIKSWLKGLQVLHCTLCLIAVFSHDYIKSQNMMLKARLEQKLLRKRRTQWKSTENYFFFSKSCLLNLENTILLMVHNNSRSREMKYQLGREDGGRPTPEFKTVSSSCGQRSTNPLRETREWG